MMVDPLSSGGWVGMMSELCCVGPEIARIVGDEDDDDTPVGIGSGSWKFIASDSWFG